jgi:hypothetical protein
MNKTSLTALAALSGAGAIAIAGASDGTARAARTIVLHEHGEGAVSFVDAPPRAKVKGEGPSRYSRGDQLVSLQPLAEDGTLHLTCTTTRAGKITRLVLSCRAVSRLPDGDIVAEGLFSPAAASSTLAVTGGTGDYAGARGTLVHAGDDDATDTITLTD